MRASMVCTPLGPLASWEIQSATKGLVDAIDGANNVEVSFEATAKGDGRVDA